MHRFAWWLAQGTNREPFCRYTVKKLETHAKFVPTALSDAALAETTQKRAALAACYHGKFDRLVGNNAACIRTVWEVAIGNESPPQLRPVKPKVWLLGQLTLEKDRYYKLL